MKKRLISFLLTLSMIFSMIPMLGIGVGALNINNDTHEENCYILPYIYRSMQWNSYNYFLTHYNINDLFDVDNLEDGFNQNLSTIIYNGRKEDAVASTVCIKILDGLFNFNGEFTQQDLYDTILINMLIDNASTEVNESKKAASEISHLLNTLTESSVEIVNSSGALVETISFFDFCKKHFDSSTKLWDLIKTEYTKSTAGVLSIAINGEKAKIKRGPVDNFLKKVTNGKITSEKISAAFEMLDYGFSALDEIEEYNIKVSNAFVIMNSVEDSAILVLEEMQKATTDVFLDTAITKYIELIETDSMTSFKKAIITSGAVELTSKILMTYFRENVLKKSLIYTTAKCIFDLAELVGNFSEKAEMVYIIECLNVVDRAVLKAMRTIENSCINNMMNSASISTCNSYIDGMLMSYRLQSLEQQYGKEYMEAWCGKKEFNKLMNDDDAWDNWEKIIDDSIKRLNEWKPDAFLNTGKVIYDNGRKIIENGLTIKYNLNGGNGYIADSIKPYNEEITLSSSIPTKSGETFLWWEFDNSQYSPGMYIDASINPCYCFDEITFTAHYADIDAITYIADKATNVPASHENKGVLSNQVPKKTGYNFLGWSTSATATKPQYNPGKPIEIDGDVTLYAIWEKIIFNIIFDADGPDADGGYFPSSHSTTITKTKPYGEAFVIDVEKPQKAGFIFADKWIHFNPKTGRTETFNHNPSKVIYDIGDETTIDKILYPVWTDATVDVLYDFNNNGVNPPETVEVDTSVSSVHTILKPSDLIAVDETDFKGWMFQDINGAYWWAGTTVYGNAYDNGKVSIIMPGQDIPLTGNLELYAKWDYYVHYNNNSTVTHDTVRDGDNYVIQAPVGANNNDQVFKYWKNGNTKYYVGDVIDLTSDLTLTAVWRTEDKVNTLLTVLTDKATYEPGDIAKINITAENSRYFRVDASDSNDFKITDAEGRKKTSGVFVENSSASEANDLKCYDDGESYVVKLYIPDDCENGSYPIEIFASNGTYDEDIDGSVNGTETSTASEPLMIMVDNGEEEKVYYTLSYHMNDGYGNLPEPVRFYDGQEVRLDNAQGFKRDGYLFSGWCEKESGKGTLYDAGEYCSFDEDTLLYAIWEEDPDYEMPDELELFATLDRYSSKTDVSWYKPGSVAGLRIDIDNSDHLFIDVRQCPGLTFTDGNGNEYTQKTFYEKTSPDYDGVQSTYTNGGVFYVSVQIPDNCRDGEYPIIIKGADSEVDASTGQSYGTILTVGVTITVRESESPDEIYLSKSELTIHEGDEKRIDATMFPEYIVEGYYQSLGDKRVTWKTSDDDVVSIDAKGNRVYVTGVESGTAIVTATCDGVSASCKVTVAECEYTIKVVDDDHLATPATCTEQATYYYECSCGDISNRKTFKAGPLVGHSYSAWETVTEPGETTSGLKQRICSECGDIESEAIPATGHITHTSDAVWHFDDEKHWHECTGENCTELLDKAAHADEDGNGKCDECGYVVETEEPHKHEPANEWKSDGTNHWHKCISCEEKLDLEAHTGGTATCQEKAKCSVCGSEYGNFASHNYDETKWGYKDATGHAHVCKTDGCGEHDTVIPHTPGAAATETEPQICTECGYVIAPATGHITHTADTSKWLYDDTYHWHKCTGCEEKMDKSVHDFGEWTVIRNATETTTGLKERICDTCGYKEEETIPLKEPTHIHSFTIEDDDDVYLRIPADCTHAAVYFKSCECGEASTTETFVSGSPLGHNWGAWTSIGSSMHQRVCTNDPAHVETESHYFVGNTCVDCGYTKSSGGGSGYIPVTYTLTFNTNGGSSIKNVYGIYGVAVGLNTFVPVRDGYDFGGWYTDPALTKPVDEIKLTGNKTVYAKWIEQFPFIDVFKSDSFYDDVAYVYDNDLMIGVSDTEFAPYTTLSRAMIVTILYRLEGEPTFMNDNIFTDVEADSWYEKAVGWANGKGIVLGYGDGRFGPTDPVTREQMAALLYRYAQYKGYDMTIAENTNFLSFDDVFSISEWAQAPMFWALDNDLIDDVNGWLYPRDNATRAVVATFLRRFCEAFVK